MGTIHFDSTPLEGWAREDGAMVVRTGLLCRSGDYPSHNFTLSPDDIRAAAGGFTDGYVEIEHFTSKRQNSLLDGECGQLRRVWASGDGTELHGDVALPSWLDRLAAKTGHKVSAVWDSATKSLKGIGLVLDPLVPDAALMSAVTAFGKRHDTPQGQSAMQHLHDVACQHGATCANGNTGMASKHEAGAIQSMHDMATEHGATCSSVGGKMMYSKSIGGRTMDLGKTFKDWFTAGPQTRDLAREAGADVPEEVMFSVVQSHADAAAREAKEVEIESLKAEKAQVKAELEVAKREKFAAMSQRVEAEGTGYVDGLITGNLALPRERESLINMYRQAALDDASHGVVTMSSGAEQSRIEAFKAVMATRAPLKLVGEQIKINEDGSTVVMGATEGKDEDDDSKPLSDAKLVKLLSFTAAGRDAVAARLAAK